MAANDQVTAIGKTFQILPANAPENAVLLHLKFTALQLTAADS
jgi:hypothetical protein